MNREIERLENAIRHINSSLDVDEWAKTEAVAAMRYRIGMLTGSGSQESTGLQIIIGKDGKAEIYDGTYDIVIHCESEREQTKIMEWLKSQKIEDEK